jgi:beta-lactamase superfamily II metal-dependent hydrolase
MEYTVRVAKAGAIAIALVAVAIYVWHEWARPTVFELYVFDTPGAPSVFIRTADDTRVVMNGGANSEIVKRLTEALPFYSRRIDRVIATDDDPKHTTGLIEILNRYDVGDPAISYATTSDDIYGVRILDAKKTTFLFEAAGERALLIPSSPATLTRKLLADARPDYLIYSAVKNSRPDKLAGIMMDRRYNVRDTGGIKMTVRDGRLLVEPLGSR